MKRRILFVHNHPTQFVQIDLALLRERYDVQEWYQRGRLINAPALANAVQHCDIVFGWFASWHTFLPLVSARQLGRPAILVVGGYDTAKMPEIGYGLQRGGFKRWIARSTMRLSTALVAISSFAKREAIENARVDDSRVTVIYLAPPDNSLVNVSGKRPLVMTAANVNRSNLIRKGLEDYARAASLVPQVQFVLVGAWRDDAIQYLRSIASANVRFTGWLVEQEMSEYFARAMVYVQASRHEAFGLAVAEAMLHGCIPVVTRAGALPEVVGDAGIYLDNAEPNCVAAGVQQALAAGGPLGKLASERVRTQFPLQRRREQLFDVFDRALHGPQHS